MWTWNEDCAYIKTNDKWNDFSCTKERHWGWTLNPLCEKPIQRQPTIIITTKKPETNRNEQKINPTGDYQNKIKNRQTMTNKLIKTCVKKLEQVKIQICPYSISKGKKQLFFFTEKLQKTETPPFRVWIGQFFLIRKILEWARPPPFFSQKLKKKKF